MAGIYVTKKLRECDLAIAAAAPRVQSGANDEEAIHDLRVGIRRLRTLLKMSRRLYGTWHADVVRRAYADVMRASGELRDEEVLEETLNGISNHSSFKTFLTARKSRERRLRKAIITRLEAGEHFDVILCDLMMPEISGIELYAQIPADERDRIVFMTGGAFTPQAREFLAKTNRPRLDKPFSEQQLRDAIERVRCVPA